MLHLNRFLANLSAEYAVSDNDDNQSDHDETEDVVLMDDGDLPQTNTTQTKAAAAVEKAMDDNQLVPFYNRYLLLLRDLQQKTQTYTERHLHDFLAELFHSLQYKNNESEGK